MQERRVCHPGRNYGKSILIQQEILIFKVRKIRRLISERKLKMGIRDLPEKPTNRILGKIKKFFKK